jgi:hypothetical protein
MNFGALVESKDNSQFLTLSKMELLRKNNTMVEIVPCMLNEAHLKNELWADAVHTAVYILNIYPTNALNIVVPAEAWN